MHDYRSDRNENGENLSEFLAKYDADRYRHQSNTVDMAVMTVSGKQLKLLLIKRRNHPFIGCWATPGGFVEYGEDLDAAALRELKEETGLEDGIFFKQLYTFGKADRDPRTCVISTAYLTLTPEENIKHSTAGDDAADALWFTVLKTVECETEEMRVTRLSLKNAEAGETICYRITETVVDNWVKVRSELIESESTNELAGDHVKLVNMAVSEVQSNAASTGIIFNMLPEEFTLGEMQRAFEGIMGRKAHRNNFRRDIMKMLIPTGRTKRYYNRDVALYRPNRLYDRMDCGF